MAPQIGESFDEVLRVINSLILTVQHHSILERSGFPIIVLIKVNRRIRGERESSRDE